MNRIFIFVILCVALVASEKIRGVRRTRNIVKRQAGGGCLYEGTVYQQGQTWTVPCKYNCVCKDGTRGYYSCTEVCPHYDTLPDGCYMQKDPNSQCCSVPKCNFQPGGTGSGGSGTVITGTSAPVLQMGSGSGHSGSFMSGGSCHDTVNNCANYGQAVCSDPQYTQWVKQNCAKFCNACGGTSGGVVAGGGGGVVSGGGGVSGGGTTHTDGGDGGFSLHFGTGGGSTGTMTGTCADAINNCAAYGASVCSDPQYDQWATKNCAKSCNKCGSMGTMTGSGGTMTGTGGTMTGTGGTGTMTGTGSCMDKSNCASFGTAICTNSAYAAFAREQCPKYCNLCSSSVSGSTCTDKVNCLQYGSSFCSDPSYAAFAQENCPKHCNMCSGGTMTGTGGGVPVIGSGGTIVGGGSGTTGGGGVPAIYPGNGGTGTGTISGSGGTETGIYPGNGGTGSGIYTGNGGTGTENGGIVSGTGTMTGGTGTMTGGTGTMTGSVQCADKTNCDQYGTSFCTNTAYTAFAQENCPKHCNLCPSSNSGTMGTCADKIQNCNSYGQSVCTDPTYAGWVSENCPAFCGKCSGSMTSGTGTGTGGSVYYPSGTGTGGGTMTGTGGGTMTGTGGGTMTGTNGGVMTGPGGTMTGTGTGSGGTMTGSSTGCVYKDQVYQQGQTWKDGCTYSCTCTNGATGQYTCTGLCVQWNLPPSCRLNPPAAGKCCQTPNCPSNVQIQYPPGYVEQ